MTNKLKNTIQEPLSDYEKAEDDLLRKALSRSYTERFHVMANLMKMSLMLRQATIKHKSISSSE